MLRAAHHAVAANGAVFKRSLASTVLLSRSWETKSVAQLRQETKSRGLSSTGTKAALVERLKSFEEKKAQEAAAPTTVAPAARRSASTAAAAPTKPSVRAAVDPNVFNIKIPDLSQPAPEIPVQVPFVPDFWDSAHNTVEPKIEGTIPKIIVVAGSDAHHAGSELLPEAALEEAQQAVEKAEAVATDAAGRVGGLFYDIASDLGFLKDLPAPKPAKKTCWELFS